MFMRTFLFVIPLLLLISVTGFGQNYLMNGTPINDCSGFFLDSGGNGNYGANEDFVTTICSDGTNTHVKLTFSGVDMVEGDTIFFYDGLTQNATTYLSTNWDFPPNAPFIIQATAENTSGCITVHFVSNGSDQAAGWSAQIECVTACQTILSDILATDPAMVPADTGYIDICPGQRVSFNGRGIYPQNGIVYQHSDATSSFLWEFGDGSTAVGPNASHVYEEPGGYRAQLKIKDVKGCENTNFLGLRIRVAGPPTFNTDELPDHICAGDTIALNSGTVISQPGSFLAGAIVSDSLALPDGTGATYQATVFITDFAPGQTLTSASDLESICVNMEHSWMHDLDIFIFCPNGDSIKLQDQEFIGNEVYLGIPYTLDDTQNPTVPAPGVGYDYCWTADAPYTWTQYTQLFDPQTLPSGDYAPFQSFSGLQGCPLNGEWTLEVRDLWGEDNGWIFEWSINFVKSLYPALEVFDPGIVDYSLVESPFSIYYTQDSMITVPTNAGEANFMVTATDGFGCVWDTSMVVPVLPPTHPDCRSCAALITPPQDAVICQNEDVAFDVLAPIEPQTNITFESFPNEPIGFSNYPNTSPFLAKINVNSIRPLTLASPTTQIVSVCVNLDTDYDSDIRMFLISPGGQTLELCTGNGGSGDNFINTCFTPTAITPITAGTPPFTGDFRPEGNWNVFNNATIAGDWTLRVSDQFGVNEMGLLKSWSITFKSTNSVTYTWTPPTGLSCTNCPDPTAAPGATTTYYVNASDSYGCVARDTVIVGVVGDLAAPDVTCDITGDGQLTFWWSQVETFDLYEVRATINGVQGDWSGPVSGLSYAVEDLENNDNVSLQVRVYGGTQPLNCIINSGNSSCVYDRCFLTLSETNVQGVTCNGDSDGTASFSALNNMGSLTYFLDGTDDGQPTPDFSSLTGGDHFVVAADIDGCTDTLYFNVPEPTAVVPSIQVVDEVNCNNGQDGALTASATGGDGVYTYSWNAGTPGSNPQINSLSPGTYALLVSDSKGCTGTASETLANPEKITIELAAQDPSCFGSTNGSVTGAFNGGTGAFSYSWSGGLPATANAANLGAGNYCVTATDANGCQETACADLTAPAELKVVSFDVTPVDCFGNETGTAQVNATGGTGTLSYLWSDPLQQINQEASFLGAGAYTVQVTDANGCQVIESIEVTEPGELTVAASGTDVLCNSGADGSASATPAGGVGPYAFQWTGGLSGQQVNNLTAGGYTVTVTDKNGCLSTSDITISQPQNPVLVTASQTFNGCNGAADNEATAMASGGVGNFTYQWNDPQNQSGGQAVNLAAQTFTVVATDGNGCAAETTVTLKDLPAVTIGIIANEPTCNGYSDGEMGVNQVTGGVGQGNTLNYTYLWSNAQSGLTINGLAGGVTYTVTVTDSQGCEGIGSRFLPNPEPVSFESATTDVSCFGSADGTASVVNIDGPNTQYNIKWGPNAGGQTTATATGLSAGTYTVTVTDNKGCFISNSVAVAQPAALKINAKTKDAGCSGEQTGFIVLNAEGGVPGYQYQWSNGATLAQLNDIGAGEYSVTITDSNNCELIQAIRINQPEPIKPDLTAQDVTCFGRQDGLISIQTNGGTPPFKYSLDNIEYKGTRTFIGLPAGNYTVFVKDANDCTTAGQVVVGTPLEFVVDAGEDRTLILGDSLQLEATSANPAPGFVEYIWTEPYAGTLSCTECTNPWASPMYSIIYELLGIDSKGCESTDLIRVNVEKPRVAMVPTGFTPNNDLTNDLLVVHGMEGTLVKTFRIFDRWGELLYEDKDFYVNDTARGWDGTFRGKPMNGGVYVWYLEVEYPYDKAEATFRGQTTLIR